MESPLRPRAAALALLWGPLLGLASEDSARAESFRCSRSSPNQGPSLQWEERRLGMGIESGTAQAMGLSTSRLIEIVEGSFAAWQAPCTDLQLEFEGVGPEFAPGQDQLGTNALGWVERWPYGEEVIALTTNSFNTRSGRMLDGDIELNGEDFTFVDGDRFCSGPAMDLANVLTHEVGHFLGLDHPPDTPSNEGTTMYGRTEPCETGKRSLSVGDEDGLCFIYPAGEPTVSCYSPGSIGFRVVPAPEDESGCRHAVLAVGGGPSPAGLAMAGLMVLMSCRRRR